MDIKLMNARKDRLCDRWSDPNTPQDERLEIQHELDLVVEELTGGPV